MFLNKKNSKKSPSADRRNLSCFCSQILIIFPGSDENAPECQIACQASDATLYSSGRSAAGKHQPEEIRVHLIGSNCRQNPEKESADHCVHYQS